MLRNFKLIIEYDGTNYCGWQRQPNDPTVQQTIEGALQTMTRRKITLTGAGRTDAGVHALGQTANFTCDTTLEPDAFHKGLNSLLPGDIVIHQCSEVDLSFHARFKARSKMYRYRIHNGPLPAAIGRQYEWWIRTPLDVHAMRSGANYLTGRKDFKAFEGTGSPRAHTIRTVTHAAVHCESKERIIFEIEADGFLRYMVRNMMGTLVAVGNGTLAPEEIVSILDSGERHRAGITAPAQGLCLIKIDY
ncbi:MAG: tRNA pseudouridine(38-40) synthase TruA [Desulfobacteraceae bacterium]|nr:MAG: tRNA pseudouridine(38-40) synthase TruA [Desulfobacteraceae bacterium]